VLDPGTYTETVDLDIALVNLRGNTNTPENGDVIINNGAAPAIRKDDNSTASGTVYIEGITLRRSHTNHYQSLAQFRERSGSYYISLVFNRCSFESTTNGYIAHGIHLDGGSSKFQSLIMDHCEWDTTGSNENEYADVNWNNINTSNVLACVYNGSYGNYGGSGSPDIHNYVTTATEGYGISYSSDWYIPLEYPPVGYFDGYITEEGTPVQRKVYLYKRTTGELLAQTTSNASGYYYIETTFSGMHHIVALDDPADPLYNDLIIGSAYPTAL
jgi:hypothetical protein